MLITHDLDFGELYHLKERGDFGVIILRLADQTVESVNRVLGQFFSDPATAEIPLTTSLFGSCGAIESAGHPTENKLSNVLKPLRGPLPQLPPILPSRGCCQPCSLAFMPQGPLTLRTPQTWLIRALSTLLSVSLRGECWYSCSM